MTQPQPFADEAGVGSPPPPPVPPDDRSPDKPASPASGAADARSGAADARSGAGRPRSSGTDETLRSSAAVCVCTALAPVVSARTTTCSPVGTDGLVAVTVRVAIPPAVIAVGLT